MKLRAQHIVMVLLLSLLSLMAVGQNADQLRERVSASEREIQKLERQINANKKKLSGSSTNLVLTEKKIKAREAIIRDLDSQTKLLGGQIVRHDKDISRKSSDLERIQNQYRDVVRNNYLIYRQSNFLSFILGAENLTEMVRRVYYLSEYNRSAKRMVDEIKGIQSELTHQREGLTKRQKDLLAVQKSKARELANLSREREELTRMKKKLQSSDATLKAKAKSYRNKIDALQRQITKIIEQEARAAAKSTSGGGKSSGTIGTGPFAKAKGRMVSPLSGGVIIDRFGIHNHPTQTGVKVNNKGVNLQAGGAGGGNRQVRAVFKGEVRRIFLVPGMGSSIILRHEGGYLSVYSNLSTVSVATGGVVESGAVLGTLQGGEGEVPMLHFEIWYETSNLNPADWVRL